MNTSRNWIVGWLVAFVGFPIGGLLTTLLIGRLETPLEGVIGGLAAGVAIGTTQWLALRRRIPISFHWIMATAIGMAVGVGVSVALFGAESSVNATLMRAPLTGLAIAIAQWLVLRRQLQSALWWIPVITIVYSVAWFITIQVIGSGLNEGFIVFGSSGAVVYQALTGLTLWLLMKAKDAQSELAEAHSG
jgi:hypothetical protein